MNYVTLKKNLKIKLKSLSFVFLTFVNIIAYVVHQISFIFFDFQSEDEISKYFNLIVEPQFFQKNNMFARRDGDHTMVYQIRISVKKFLIYFS